MNFLMVSSYFFDNLLVQLALIILVIKLGGHISVKAGQPSILGKLLVGIILGPSILNFIQSGAIINNLAQLGVILLMFLAGLETRLYELKRNINVSFFSALGGVLVPFFCSLLFGLMFDFSMKTAAFIGVVLVSTSVSITVQTLRELGRLQTKEGYTILGAAIIDDMFGLFLLSFVISMTNAVNFKLLYYVALKIILFFFLLILLGVFLIPWIIKLSKKILVTEGELAACLMTAFFLSYLAELLGLAGIVGAYFAGLLLGRSKNKDKLAHKIAILGNSFFFPIFFVSIGLNTNIGCLQGSLLIFTLLLAIIAIITKILGAGAGAFLMGFDLYSSAAVGVGMLSRGEVALIIANIGISSGLVSKNLYTSLIIITIITTIITPLIIKKMFLRK